MAAAANQETHLCEACANSHPWNGQSSVSHYLPGYSTEARANPGQVGDRQPHEGKYTRTITFLSQEFAISKYADLTSKVFRAELGAEATIRGPV